MDIKTFMQNLYEQAYRSVYTSKFAYPKQVPGLHDYRLEGQQRIEGTKSRILTESASHNDISADTLPAVTRITSPGLLSALVIEESHKNGVKCGNCDKTSTKASYCFQCCCFWCDVCLVLHNGIKSNHRHKALALKDFRDGDLENILKYSTFQLQKARSQEQRIRVLLSGLRNFHLQCMRFARSRGSQDESIGQGCK